MKSSRAFWTIVATTCAAAAAAVGADLQKPGPEPKTLGCHSSHSAGTADAKFSFCVSANGNVAYLEAPAGYVQLPAGRSEGYNLCEYNPATATFVANYYDINTAANGWAASSIAQPNGANTFPLTITRVTLDGHFSLKQVFSWNKLEKSMKIAMTLKNTSGAMKSVVLWRYFDADIDNTATGDIWSHSDDSVWGSETSEPGLVLTGLTFNTLHFPNVRAYPGGYPGTLPEMCNPGTGVITPTTPGDFVGQLGYSLNLAAGKSSTLTVQYRQF